MHIYLVVTHLVVAPKKDQDSQLSYMHFPGITRPAKSGQVLARRAHSKNYAVERRSL
jgi:hypothetical protein